MPPQVRVLLIFFLTGLSGAAAGPDHLTVIASDPRLQLVMHPAVRVMEDGGRQPFLFCTSDGVLLCQAQFGSGQEPFRSKPKMGYPIRLGMNISRDGGQTWTPVVREKDHDDVNLEGSAITLGDGTIYMLDTYIVPGVGVNHGVAEVWRSHDDFRTWEGPTSADVALPAVEFTGSTDDYGRGHQAAVRLHRSIISLPNGDFLASAYGRFARDTAPSAYMPTMMKGRCVVLRSRDQGASWAYLATVAVDGGVGTEGFGEPVIVRVERGPHTGRILCQMRTGRDLYGAHSDDGGATWSRAVPIDFPGIDIRATEKWKKYFADPKVPDSVPTDDLIGDVVDPDLIQLQNGTLVAAIGVRIPARKCFENWRAPENGDYLAFSLDGGDTWSEVTQFRSGQPTTHYMGIREISPNVAYVVYDASIWGHPGETLGFRLEVKRNDAAALHR